MNLVTLENIHHQYSERVLLEGVDLLINRGDRLGLIGINGSGKTTLLRIIAGDETPDGGSVTVWGGVRMRYLSQEPVLDDNLSVLDQLFQSDAPQMRLLREYQAASLALDQHPEDSEIHERYDILAKIRGRDLGQVRDMLIQRIRAIPNIVSSEAYTVYKTWKRDYGVNINHVYA